MQRLQGLRQACTARRLIVALSLLFGVQFSVQASEESKVDSLFQRIQQSAGRDRFELSLQYMDQSHWLISQNLELVMRDATEWARNNGDTLDRLRIRLHKAMRLSEQGQRIDAMRLATEVNSSLESDASTRFRAQILLRDIYYGLGSYDKAIEIHSGLDWSVSPDWIERIVPDVFLAFTYGKMGEHTKSIEIMREASRTTYEHNEPYWHVSYTNSLGVFFEQNGQLDSAMQCYKRAQVLLERYFDPGKNMDVARYNYIEGLFFGNIAQVLAASGMHLKAIPLYKIDIAASAANQKDYESLQNKIASLIKLSASYLATQQAVKCRMTLRAAQADLRIINLPSLEEKWLRSMWQYYDAVHQTDSALLCAEKYFVLRDSIDHNASLERAVNLQLAYSFSQKERELERQRRELQELKLENQRDEFFLQIAIAVTLLLIVITFVVVLAYRQRVRSEKSLAEKNAMIEHQSITIAESLKEKDLLLREVHHRVKNNLQIISSLFFLQSKKITDPLARQVIREGQSRVHVMSLIHQKLYQSDQLDVIDFQGYFYDLARQIIHGFQLRDQHITLEVDAHEIIDSVETAVPMGMIINELITNSLKHGFKDRQSGTITIRMKRIERLMRLEYSDDGSGMQTDIDTASPDTLGMKLIQLLSNQLNAQVQFDHSHGFYARIEFEA